jgi:hypothetical protein
MQKEGKVGGGTGGSGVKTAVLGSGGVESLVADAEATSKQASKPAGRGRAKHRLGKSVAAVRWMRGKDGRLRQAAPGLRDGGCGGRSVPGCGMVKEMGDGDDGVGWGGVTGEGGNGPSASD